MKLVLSLMLSILFLVSCVQLPDEQTPLETDSENTESNGKCIKANPSLSLSQTNFNDYVGEDFSFNLTVKNNNQNCTDATYSLSFDSLPSGFSSDLPGEKKLANGEEIVFLVNILTGNEKGISTVVLKAQDKSNLNYKALKSLSFELVEESAQKEAKAPILESAIRDGNNYILVFKDAANSLIPSGGYDTYINSVDQNDNSQFSGFTRNLAGLDKTKKQCFKTRVEIYLA